MKPAATVRRWPIRKTAGRSRLSRPAAIRRKQRAGRPAKLGVIAKSAMRAVRVAATSAIRRRSGDGGGRSAQSAPPLEHETDRDAGLEPASGQGAAAHQHRERGRDGTPGAEDAGRARTPVRFHRRSRLTARARGQGARRAHRESRATPSTIRVTPATIRQPSLLRSLGIR